MERVKCQCRICGRYVSKSNLSKHEKSCKRITDNLTEEKKSQRETYDFIYSLVSEDSSKVEDGFKCPYCGKVTKSFQGLLHHLLCCKNNNNLKGLVNTYGDTRCSSCAAGREKIKSQDHSSWNKGLTRDTDERVRSRGEKLSNRYKSGELVGTFKGRKHTQETKERLRKIALERGLGGHCYKKVYEVDGKKFDSSFEQILALNLNDNNIKWEKPKRFNYIDNEGKLHTYTADFYLSEYDVYLDPKNDFLIENINPALGFSDLQKIQWVMEQNNITVIVLNKDELNWESVKSKI